MRKLQRLKVTVTDTEVEATLSTNYGAEPRRFGSARLMLKANGQTLEKFRERIKKGHGAQPAYGTGAHIEGTDHR